MLLSRRALSAHLRTPWRAASPSLPERRWFQGRHSRTVLLQGSENMNNETILSGFPTGLAAIINTNVPLFVILSTPSLATRLLSPSGPTSTLQNLLARVLGRSLEHRSGATIRGVRVLSAVVDALPAPETGRIAEGISYMILTDEQEDPVIAPDEADHDEFGTLEFNFSDSWHRISRSKAKVPLGETDCRVAIKLANTLFLSGRKKTLLDATYLVHPSGDLHLTRHEWLAHCSIPYHAREPRSLGNFDQRILKTDKLLNLSVIPLTEPRKISVSLGNILRTVELPDGSQRPASHELEANLESYFRVTEQQPHPRPVWALLTDESGVERSRLVSRNAQFIDFLNGEPRRRSPLEIIWSQPDLEASAEYEMLLRESILLDGAKLQRVLSGGGGWGDKAGLLALDPHDLIQAPRSNEEEIVQFSSDDPGHTHVQFFTSTNTPAPHLFQYDQGIYMGVVPDGTPKWMPPIRSRDIDIYSMTFAALSHEGMSFRTNTRINEADFPILQEHPKVTTRTKVDVPFASFTYLMAEPHSKRNRTMLRGTEAIEMAKSNLAEGYKLLRRSCEVVWKILRNTLIALQRNEGVDLWTRRDQITPFLDPIIQIYAAVHPAGLEYFTGGIQQFIDMADKEKKGYLRQEIAKIKRQIPSTDTLIDQVATQISRSLRRSQDYLLDRHDCDVHALQRKIAAIYDDLIRIVGDAKPKNVDNYRNAFERTMSVVMGFRVHYYHNEFFKLRSFVRKARAQIDESKCALGIPVTHFAGTAGANAEKAATDLRSSLENAPQGLSENNLSEMKYPGPRNRA